MIKLKSKLTPHEKEILYLLSKGYTRKKIANEFLFITEGTLRDEICDVYKKFDIPEGYDKGSIAILYGLTIKNPHGRE